ncbi:hypothetical protein SAMN04487894_101318 [Niabella drilacis]|uniref:Uncharacterized protein n=2 Tax=Niabella drilacis (strain DSM 25811 / CCM 8410 / CCUG 62505 / LMG 26954 / E90) TaxID=1285928 RepID=A0A1G6ISU6_NIADE|nr:hypothetical protein SAMN04487894_101318 [Niabella drilacis]
MYSVTARNDSSEDKQMDVLIADNNKLRYHPDSVRTLPNTGPKIAIKKNYQDLSYSFLIPAKQQVIVDGGINGPSKQFAIIVNKTDSIYLKKKDKRVKIKRIGMGIDWTVTI